MYPHQTSKKKLKRQTLKNRELCKKELQYSVAFGCNVKFITFRLSWLSGCCKRDSLELLLTLQVSNVVRAGNRSVH